MIPRPALEVEIMNFRNMLTVSPSDVCDGDCFALNVVAVAGYNNDWAAYWGPSSWSDERVAQEGDKLRREVAEPLFYLGRSGRTYLP